MHWKRGKYHSIVICFAQHSQTAISLQIKQLNKIITLQKDSTITF